MRNDRLRLAAGLLVAWAVLAGVLVAKNGLFVAKHEGDTMHLVEIVLRQAAGQWPHLDFMTPIGVLATGPIAAFVAAGWDVGAAVLWAQAAVALALLPALWWVGVSRMGLGWGLAFGAICLILASALVHGEPERSLSISMHYNRWAWAIAFPALAVAILPPRQVERGWADGLVLGLCVAALALIKVTYVVAIFPVILLSLAMRRDGAAFVTALIAGGLVAGAVTVAAGFGFWAAYIGDLQAVSASTIRSAPGDTFIAVMAAPAYLGGSLAALAGVMFLRQAGRSQEGLLLLVALPGFFFVTYQNYGNDPQWLYLVGLLLLALRPEPGTATPGGLDLRQALALTGCAVFTLGLPSLLNLTSSPMRHLTIEAQGYEPLLPQSDQAADVMFRAVRQGRVTGSSPLPGFPLPGVEPAVLNGVDLAECQLNAGTTGFYAALAERLEQSGQGGRAILVADLFNPLWMFGDFPPLQGGAPWYYGGLPGGEMAETMLVPLCPVLPRARRQVLASAEAAGWTLTETARDPLYILLEIQRP